MALHEGDLTLMTVPPSILSESPRRPSKYGRQESNDNGEDTDDEVHTAIC